LPFVDEEARADVSSVDDVEGIDHVVEADQGGRLDEFISGDPACIEVATGIQEPAAGRGGLGLDLIQVLAQFLAERHREVLQGTIADNLRRDRGTRS